MNVYPLSRPQSELRQEAGRKLAGRQAKGTRCRHPLPPRKGGENRGSGFQTASPKAHRQKEQGQTSKTLLKTLPYMPRTVKLHDGAENASVCLVTRSHPTLCGPVDCSPPGFSVCGFLRQGYWSILPQGIFTSQGLNLHFLPWQADSLLLWHLGSPPELTTASAKTYIPLYFSLFKKEMSTGLKI